MQGEHSNPFGCGIVARWIISSRDSQTGENPFSETSFMVYQEMIVVDVPRKGPPKNE